MFTSQQKIDFMPTLNKVDWERNLDGGISGQIHVTDKHQVHAFAMEMTLGFGAVCAVESVTKGLCKLTFNQAQVLELQTFGLKDIRETRAAHGQPQTPVARATPGKGAAKPTR